LANTGYAVLRSRIVVNFRPANGNVVYGTNVHENPAERWSDAHAARRTSSAGTPGRVTSQTARPSSRW
jgi:hypothetical protein